MGTNSDFRPGRRWVAVTPSDTVNLPPGARALYVGGLGNVAIVGDDDVAVTMTAPALGVWHNLGMKRVNATNTTATLILAGY
jgi:hypothetical protein